MPGLREVPLKECWGKHGFQTAQSSFFDSDAAGTRQTVVSVADGPCSAFKTPALATPVTGDWLSYYAVTNVDVTHVGFGGLFPVPAQVGLGRPLE